MLNYFVSTSFLFNFVKGILITLQNSIKLLVSNTAHAIAFGLLGLVVTIIIERLAT